MEITPMLQTDEVMKNVKNIKIFKIRMIKLHDHHNILPYLSQLLHDYAPVGMVIVVLHHLKFLVLLQ